RLLIAEDNRTNMLIARKLLERSVASLAEAGNGRIAVEMYRANPPDLVLMDVSMPEMDGLAATRAIRAHEAEAGLPRCPIHALTAYASAEQESACLEAGLDGVLTKPLSRADLYALIERTAAPAGFDLSPKDGLDMGGKGGTAWSISPPESTITTGRSTRSSGH
ncbi:MAG: response regulator, partial [Rhodobacteraceae bacterium]|nr:response regulator [Paracoccaceae bacterium]